MREDLVTFRDAGMPPSSMRAYVEDMLNELADMADRLNDLDLATAIRNAGVAAAAANANAKIWSESRHRPAGGGEPAQDDED